jgi:hypothetical protein
MTPSTLPTFLTRNQRQKGQEGQEGVSLMTPSNFPTFLTFLTFLTRKLCFRHSPPAPWQGPEIPSYPGRQRLGPPTVGPTGRPESWSQVATAPAGASRIDAAMPHGS